MEYKHKLLRGKRLWLILVGVLGMFSVAYMLLFTTSQPELKVRVSSSSVRVIGNPANYQKSIGSTEIAGSKELCWIPPECKQIAGKREKEGWGSIELDRLSDIEKKCLFECLPYPDSLWAGEREIVTFSLTGNQITQLIATYLPKNYKVNDLIVDISGGILYFQGVSSHPLLPGKITGELLRENHQYKLRRLHAGQVPVPQRIQTSLERNLDSAIIDSLATYGVSLANIKMENDKLIVTVETLKGLVEVNRDTVIINFEILPIPIPTKPEEDYRIQ